VKASAKLVQNNKVNGMGLSFSPKKKTDNTINIRTKVKQEVKVVTTATVAPS
jgi:hypothetical protein